MRRYDCLAILAPMITDELVVTNVARSGFEWHALSEREGNIYTMGMGCVTPICLGMSLSLPHRRVIAIDGDGSMLLNLGALTTVANTHPRNLIVLVFDNESYASTGGLPTHTAGETDLAGMAQAAGVGGSRTVESLDGFKDAVQRAFASPGPWVIVCKVSKETEPVGPKLMDGRENKYRFVRYLEQTENRVVLRPSKVGRREGPRRQEVATVDQQPPAGSATANLVAEGLMEAGFDFVCSLPATQLHVIQSRLRDDPAFTYVPASNEGEGVTICAGAWLTGKTPVMVMETSGILVSTYALLRCHATFGIPTLMLSTYRGDLGEVEWYAVHTGAALQGLLQAMKIPSTVLNDPTQVKQVLLEARRTMDVSLHPVSVVLGGRLTRGQATDEIRRLSDPER
jgi:sulfopyruvate decarboxylase TPP-binding subunit